MLLVTVITATYNAESVLPALIESLRAQTSRNFEWVVVDGASRDGTVDLLKNAGDVVTRWTSEPDFGVYDALNKGLSLVGSDYYLVVGADDTLDSGAIGRYHKAVLDTRADIISAPIWVGKQLVCPRSKLSWFRSEPPLVSGHSVGALILKALHDELGYYSKRFPIAADTHFFLKAWRAGKVFTRLDEPAGAFGTAGMSSTDVLGALTEYMRVNAEVRPYWLIHFSLFVLRVFKNIKRIGVQRKF
jgi:glycosyltransferase involved in cell wall biosynthesis